MKDGCGVKCFGCQGLHNHAHAYVGNVYVCAVLEKGRSAELPLHPEGLSTLGRRFAYKPPDPSVSKPDPNLHTPTTLTWVISMARRALRTSSVTAQYV